MTKAIQVGLITACILMIHMVASAGTAPLTEPTDNDPMAIEHGNPGVNNTSFYYCECPCSLPDHN